MYAGCILTSTAVSAASNCTDVIAALAPLSNSLSVRIDPAPILRVGSTSSVSVEWSFESQLPANLPVYFIVSTKAPVRFAGLGFMALSEDATGPSRIRAGTGQTRAVVPLHNPTA